MQNGVLIDMGSFPLRLWRLCLGKQIKNWILCVYIENYRCTSSFYILWMNLGIIRNWRIWGSNCIQQQSILNHPLAKKTINKCEFLFNLTCSFLFNLTCSFLSPKPNGMYYIEGDFTNLCRVVETLKDYTMKALVNTVDHLGSMAYKVNHCLDEKIGEVSKVELRFHCIQQVVLKCNFHVNSRQMNTASAE